MIVFFLVFLGGAIRFSNLGSTDGLIDVHSRRNDEEFLAFNSLPNYET